MLFVQYETLESLKIFATGISRFADLLYRPNADEEMFLSFRDSLSHAQIQSKLHLLELSFKHQIPCEKTLFIGHWHGLLPYMFLKLQLTRVALGIELNPQWVEVSESVCAGLSWNSILGDATTLNPQFFADQNFDCIINTSCEHMNNDWLKPLPKDIWIMAQSNNYDLPEHANRQESLNSFKQSLFLNEVIHADEIDFGIYKRFTVIGKK